jgi:formylglycine-generating enzyme required for sulfatase activity
MKMCRNAKLWVAVVALALIPVAGRGVVGVAPVVTNVQAVQRTGTGLVDIFYDVSHVDNAILVVSVAVSTNNGATYDLPTSSFSNGNPIVPGVGSAVMPGTGHWIVWDALADWPGQYSQNVQFRITAYAIAFPAAGMILVPGGMNAGTDPDFGAYSLSVDSFYMDKHEVTKALWDVVKNWNGGNGYVYENPGSGKATNHPVHSVNWYDCMKWCNARSQSEGRTPAYYTDAAFTQVYKTGRVDDVYVKLSANGDRLPTAEQGEYAARGGAVGRRFPWNDSNEIQHSRANYYSWDIFSYDTSPTRGYHPSYLAGGIPYTSPVGSFAANGYGLYDLTGNLKEWCLDWHPNYVGTCRAARGGSWDSDASYTVGAISPNEPQHGNNEIGLRTIRPPSLAASHAATSARATVNTINTRRLPFAWPIVTGATWHQLWITRNGQLYLAPWVAGTTSWTPPASGLPSGNYQWWVRGWGPGIGFTVWMPQADFPIETRAPGAVTQNAPIGAQSSHNLNYRWNKDANATWYRLWVGRVGGGTWHDRWFDLAGTGEASVNPGGADPGPAKPIQTAPAGTIATNRPTFQWSGGACEWWLQGWGPDGYGPWAGPKAFSIPHAAGTWHRVYVNRGSSVAFDRWTNSTNLPAPSTLSSGAHSWWLGVWDAARSQTIWSDRLDFTVPP